jgi:hypothetical protein
MSRLNDFLKKYGVWIVITVSILASIGALIYFYGHHDILAYNDARSRLNIARRVTDSQSAGIVQLGTIWLPLQQFLMIPFAASSYLWHTGLAGSFVSMLAFVIVAIYAFKTVSLLTDRVWLAFLSALLIVLNVNVLYIQTTAMTEIILLCTTIGAIYHLLKWLIKKSLTSLVAAGVWIMLATLTRYEGWFLLAASTLVIIVELLLIQRDKLKTQGLSLLFLTLAGFGIFLWFLWNLVFWHNPVYFLSGQNNQYGLRDSTPAAHSVMTTTSHAWQAAAYNVGPALLVLGIVAVVTAMILKTDRSRRYMIYAVLLFMSPVLFNMITLFLGITDIGIGNHTHPYPFNIRYFFPVVLLVAIFIPIALRHVKKYGQLAGALVAIVLTISTVPMGLYNSAVQGGRSQTLGAKHFVSYFKANYHGGGILASTYGYDASMQALQIPMKNYIYEGVYKKWDDTLKSPSKHVKYILMKEKSGDGTNNVEPVYAAYKKHRPAYDDNFKIIYHKDSNIVMMRSTSLQRNSLPATISHEQSIDPMAKPATNTSSSKGVIVRKNDTQSKIIRSQIRLLDGNNNLTKEQIVYIETSYIAHVGSRDHLEAGNVVTVDIEKLLALIDASRQLDQNTLALWHNYANKIE